MKPIRLFSLLIAVALASCSADATRSLPMPGANRRPSCEPGTFMGNMTLNCPQPAK